MLTIIRKRDGKEGYYSHIPCSSPWERKIAFLHRSVNKPREGIFNITNIKNVSTYSFLCGDYVKPDLIDVDSLMNYQLYQLASYGKIDYLGSIYGHDCIVVEDMSILDRAKYIAFLIDGNFKFIPLYKYTELLIRFKKQMGYLNRKYIHEGIINPYMAMSSQDINIDALDLDDDSLIRKNLKDIIWRRILKSDNEDSNVAHIALYKADRLVNFNFNLLVEIQNYNREVADELKERLQDAELNTLKKTLYYYGLL